MAPLEQAEKDTIIDQILLQLSVTTYACSSLTQLTNGTTNFVFRGTLANPVHPSLEVVGEGTETKTIQSVIVKYSASFAALNKDLPIDVSRCVFISFNSDNAY